MDDLSQPKMRHILARPKDESRNQRNNSRSKKRCKSRRPWITRPGLCARRGKKRFNVIELLKLENTSPVMYIGWILHGFYEKMEEFKLERICAACDWMMLMLLHNANVIA
ncbi:hypothetical protein P8452_39188 [Trifolium repens]|nr:hypothetical protein P8452_39188 [Trifolium repens]WJX53160.1 hypothetical protein P8452_39188 [Trifolium repens]